MDGERDPRSSSFFQRRWGWIVTIATFFIQLFGVGLLYSFSIVNIALQEEFGVGVTTAGWIPTIATGLNLIGGVLTDEIIKRSSHRLVAIMGVSLCFCATLITSFMPSFYPVIFTFGILYGIGLAFSAISGMIMIVEWFPKTSGARASAFAVAGTSTGMLVLNPIVYVLVSGVGWRNALRIMGSVLLVVGYAASATFSKPTKQSYVTSTDDEQSETAMIETKVSLERTTKENNDSAIYLKTTTSSSSYDLQNIPASSYDILLFPEFWFLFIGIIIAAMSVTFFLFYWVKLLLTLDFAESTAALSMTVIGASDLVGKLFVSGIADYLPFPKLFLFHIALASGIPLICVVMNLKYVVAVFFTSVAVGVLILALINATPYIASIQVFPGRGATPMTTSIIAVGIGTILGTLYGTSVDQTGSFSASLYGCIGANVLAILLFSSVPLYQKVFAPIRYVMWDDVQRYTCGDDHKNSDQEKDCNLATA